MVAVLNAGCESTTLKIQRRFRIRTIANAAHTIAMPTRTGPSRKPPEASKRPLIKKQMIPA
jgi:hypothetical protein